MPNDSSADPVSPAELAAAVARGELELIAGHVQPVALPLAAESSHDPTSPMALARLTAAAQSLRGDTRTNKLRRAIEAIHAEDLKLAGELAVEVLAEDEGQVLAWRILATAREKLGDHATALQCLEQVFNRAPDTPGIVNDIGRVAFHTGLFPEAEALFRMHLAEHPEDYDALNNLACAVRDQMRLDEAVDLLKTGLLAAPGEVLLWNNLATVMSALGDATNAMIFFDEAIRLDPDYAKAIYNRANLKLVIADLVGAVADGRLALSKARNVTDQAMMRLALSLSLLASGEIEEGWQAYEARRDPHFADVTLYPFPVPLWTPDDDLAGRTVLLVGEQGLGDEVMFASMIPDLQVRIGPEGRLLLAVEPRLVDLFKRSFPTATVGAYATGALGYRTLRVAPFADPQMDRIDFWATGGAPLRLLRHRLDQFSTASSFLTADPARVAHWRGVLADLGPQPKVGVLWKSLFIDPARSRHFSPFQRWAPVLRMSGVTMVNLQYGDCSVELAQAEAEGIAMWTPPGIDLKNDLDDLAALTVALDLVVGPANATTNIAAACGAQVSLVSLPGAWPQLGTTGWPWYPQLRVMVARACGDWDSAIAALADDIAARFSLDRSAS